MIRTKPMPTLLYFTCVKYLAWKKRRFIYYGSFCVDFNNQLFTVVEDLNLPLSLQCGGFQNLQETVVLWFSSGGTKSHLHRDMLDNINCLLDGKKEIIFIDKVWLTCIQLTLFFARITYTHTEIFAVMFKFACFSVV